MSVEEVRLCDIFETKKDVYRHRVIVKLAESGADDDLFYREIDLSEKAYNRLINFIERGCTPPPSRRRGDSHHDDEDDAPGQTNMFEGDAEQEQDQDGPDEERVRAEIEQRKPELIDDDEDEPEPKKAKSHEPPF